MNVPNDLRYTSDHEWLSADGPAVRVGITDYAQDALGDVVFVQLPEVGSVLAQRAVMGEIESTKSVSEIYAPVAGTVTQVNLALEDNPELVNSDPYGEGWIAVIESSGGASGELLDAGAYSALIEA